MSQPTVGSYRDADGHRHQLVVRASADRGWDVLDLDLEADTAYLVEALSDGQDGRPQAEAIARDYLTTVGAHALCAGPAAPEAIPEQGGSDDRSHRRSRPHVRDQRGSRAALPGAAR